MATIDFAVRLPRLAVALVVTFWLLLTLALFYIATPGFEHSDWVLWAIPVMGALSALAFGLMMRNWLKQHLQVRRQKRELMQSESRTRAILRSMMDGVVYIDQRGVILSVNDAVERMFGYDSGELIGRNVSILMPEPHATAHDGYLRRHLETHQSHIIGRQLVTIAKRQDGSLFSLSLGVNEVVDDAGSTFIGVLRDISEQKAAEEALRTSERRFRSLIEVSNEGVLVVDVETLHILYANPAIEILLGYDAAALLNLSIAVLYPEATREKTTHLFLEVVQHGGAFLLPDVLFQHQDGTPLYCTVSAQHVDVFDRPCFVGFLSDTSARVETERKLSEAKRLAEEMAQAKSQFLANMSHEIRTPMNAILGMAELCLRTDLSARSRDYTEKINVSARSLLGILNDILDFSKIDSGQLQLESIPFNLKEILKNLRTLLGQQAREKALELIVSLTPGTPAHLMGDPLRLQQVLVNLVSNAIKFTVHGKVEMTVGFQEREEGAVTLNFAISDTGIGITPEQLQRLFMPFTQADTSTTRIFGGTGLGLAISAQLVERMGGKIKVDSSPNEGSIFRFAIRLKRAPAPLKEMADALRGRQVLVVDDDALVCRLLATLLGRLGCHVDVAESGEAALALLTRAEQPYHAILLDYQLPGMDGITAARHIRKTPSYVDTPIIMVTAREIEAVFAMNEGAGIDAFLSKPVSHAMLCETLSSLFLERRGAPRMPNYSAEVDCNLAGRRILLVDDNELNRQVAGELLALASARVDFAENGRKAVEAVAGQEYDLVLMDLQMPEMDGYTATRVIRESHPGLPIIALTAHAMVEEREPCLAAGMNDIITKPILPELLYATLSRVLGSNPPPPLLVTERQNNAASPSPAGLDVASGLDYAGGRRDIYARTLRKFYDTRGSSAAEIRAALESGDHDTARRLAHTLKSNAGVVGAISLQEAAAALEKTLKAGSGEEMPVLARVEESLAAALAEMAGWLAQQQPAVEAHGITQ